MSQRVRYARAPGPALRAQLAPGGLLHPLLHPWRASGLPLDLQLRESDVAQLYCGQTALLKARVRDLEVVVDASTTYRTQPCAARLFRCWYPGQVGLADQIAVDPAGRLVLIELKHGASSNLYHAPVQLLRYAWEWHAAVSMILEDLQRLIEAKTALRLLPAELAPLRAALRLVLAFGEQEPSTEVGRRLTQVLALVEAHLPPSVGPIEVWFLPETGPQRIR